MIIVRSHNIVQILNRSIRTAQREIQQAKEHFGKGKKHFLTLEEYCDFRGLDYEQIKKEFFT